MARLSNSYGELEYSVALKVLKRIYARRQHGIVIFRHAAGQEIVPSSFRLVPAPASGENSGEMHKGSTSIPVDTGSSIPASGNEITKNCLCQGKALFAGIAHDYAVEDPEFLDIQRAVLPVNLRYRLLAYGDASFVVGDAKQSVTGFVIYLNGVPLLWGSLKQTVVVDSSSSAEFVAASVTCKQLLHAENMVGFLGFSSPKPYRLYTDSKACFHMLPTHLGWVMSDTFKFDIIWYAAIFALEISKCAFALRKRCWPTYSPKLLLGPRITVSLCVSILCTQTLLFMSLVWFSIWTRWISVDEMEFERACFPVIRLCSRGVTDFRWQ